MYQSKGSFTTQFDGLRVYPEIISKRGDNYAWLSFDGDVRDIDGLHQTLKQDFGFHYAGRATQENGKRSVYCRAHSGEYSDVLQALGCTVVPNGAPSKPSQSGENGKRTTRKIDDTPKDITPSIENAQSMIDGVALDLNRAVKVIKRDLPFCALPVLRDAQRRETNGQARRNVLANLRDEIASRKAKTDTTVMSAPAESTTPTESAPLTVADIVATMDDIPDAPQTAPSATMDMSREGLIRDYANLLRAQAAFLESLIK